MKKLDILMRFKYGKYYVEIMEDLNLDDLKGTDRVDIWVDIVTNVSLFPTSKKEKLMFFDKDNDILFFYEKYNHQYQLIRGKYEVSKELFDKLYDILVKLESINLTVEYWFKDSMVIKYNNDKDKHDLTVYINILNDDYFTTSKYIYFSNCAESIGSYSNCYKGVFLGNNDYIIPKCKNVIEKTSFDILKKLFTEYNYIINKEKYYVNYEVLKIENIGVKSNLFIIKDSNIPHNWVEENILLIQKSSLNDTYGKILNDKIILLDFNSKLAQNVNVILSNEYTNKLKSLFDNWNNGNKKSKKSQFIKFLYDEFKSKITNNNNYYYVKINDKFVIQVDVQTLQILEVKTNYYNLKISYIDELNRNIDKIRQKINELNS